MPLDDHVRDEVRAEAGSFAPDVERNLRSIRRQVDPGPGTTSWMLAAAATFVLVGVLVLGVLPRGGPDRGSAPSRSGPRPTAAGSGLAEALRATAWTATLTPAGGSDAGAEVAGTWRMLLDDQSRIELLPPVGSAPPGGLTTIRGVFGVDKGHFVTSAFTTGFGATCAGPGSYQVELVEGRLTLSGTDTCRLRRAVLATTPWTRADP